ncbi:MAG: sugar ABC transporter ATP-binding protein [Cyanobacteria bacterium]|nr:sugar ABC transporter ATP-binding protein [Cyanobacteriota bacterium]
MNDYVLEMRNITKSFPGVKALNNVNFFVKKGEVHALLGENGAGKSTLMKILSGTYIPDSGEIFIEGEKVVFSHPLDGIRHGIAVIYQELNLVPTMNAIDNVLLGHEISKNGFIREKENKAEALKWINLVGKDIIKNYNIPVSELSVAQQQMVEIAKALSLNAKILVMDEPSATLTDKELDKLFSIIKELKNSGVTIIYISHRLEEIFYICDRATVLRDGNFINTVEVKDVDKNKIISMMIGRDLKNTFPPKTNVVKKDILLSVRNLNIGKRIKDISFDLYAGEILGVFGLVGSGRTELMRAIIGADKYDNGIIVLEGKNVCFKHPKESIQMGIGFATEDRKAQGLFLNLDIKSNISMACLGKFRKNGIINSREETKNAIEYVNELNIKTPSIYKNVKELSGGNQQKVVLAKWLSTNSKILILDEPTHGIDVGAKYEIYMLMNNLAEKGFGVIMISSELPEILGMSDRIIIMHEGRITGQLKREKANESRVMHYATGATD